MKKVKMPRRIIGGNTADPGRPIAAASLNLTIQMTGVSSARMTVPAGQDVPAMRELVELYNQNGSIGIYRVNNIAWRYGQRAEVTMMHGRDTFSDHVWAAAEEYDGSISGYLDRIIGYQSEWQKGTCEDGGTIKKSINYARLDSLLTALEADESDYMFSYDFSTTPWTIHFIRKPEGIESEFRFSRNLEEVTVTFGDADLCTRLRLSVNVAGGDEDATTTETVIRTYDNTAAQQIWGIVEKTADIDTADDIAGGSFPEADAWAAKFLSERSAPGLQIQISGEELKQYTGEPWDEMKIGRMCRVALPGFDAWFEERAVTITYPDAIGQPEKVNVSLANTLPKFSESITTIKKTAEETAAEVRETGRSSASAKQLEKWSQIVRHVEEAVDGTGIFELWESGIEMDAQEGIRLYSLYQGLTSSLSELKINSESISTLVRKTGINELGENETMYSKVTQTSSQISSVVAKTGINELGEEETLYSRINQRAESISQEVTNLDTKLTSRIQQTDSKASMAVGTVKYESTAHYSSKKKFPATGETGTLYYADDTGYAYLWMEDTKSYELAAVDEYGNANFVKAGEIAISINESGNVEAKLDADVVYAGKGATTLKDLELPDWMDTTEGLVAGKATFGELDAVKARVSALETDYLKTTNLSSAISSLTNVQMKIATVTDELYIPGSAGSTSARNAYQNSNLSFDSKKNQYTLTLYKFNGNSDIWTFSRATSLSGSWSGGNFTVTANDKNVKELVEIITGTSIDGTPTLNGLNSKYIDATVQVLAKEQGESGTGEVVYSSVKTINASAVYNNVGIDSLTWNGSGTGTIKLDNGKTGTIYVRAKASNADDKPYVVSAVANNPKNGTASIVTASTGSLGLNMSASVDSVLLDCSEIYTAGETAGKTAGKNAVTINKGSWSGGQVQFTKSEGTESTKGVKVGLSGSWNTTDPNKYDYTIKDYYDNSEGVTTGYTGTINASARYTSGRYDGGRSAWLYYDKTITAHEGKLAYGAVVKIRWKDANDNWYDVPNASWATPDDRYRDGYDAGYAAGGGGDVSHSPTASVTTGWTGSISGRTSLGSANASSLAHTYILIDAKCGGNTKKYYLTIN